MKRWTQRGRSRPFVVGNQRQMFLYSVQRKQEKDLCQDVLDAVGGNALDQSLLKCTSWRTSAVVSQSISLVKSYLPVGIRAALTVLHIRYVDPAAFDMLLCMTCLHKGASGNVQPYKYYVVKLPGIVKRNINTGNICENVSFQQRTIRTNGKIFITWLWQRRSGGSWLFSRRTVYQHFHPNHGAVIITQWCNTNQPSNRTEKMPWHSFVYSIHSQRGSVFRHVESWPRVKCCSSLELFQDYSS